MPGTDCLDVVDEPGLSTNPKRVHSGLNGGYQTMGRVYHRGVAKIVLLGYDMQKTGGQLHHHGKHEGQLPNLGTLPEWRLRMVQMSIDLRAHGVRVINATRETALTCFDRAPIAQALLEETTS